MESERLEFTLLITQLLHSWGLSLNQQIILLKLPDNTSTRQMRKYIQGIHCLPDEPSINERVEHLVGIADALRTTYPTNPMMGSLWLNRQNTKFEKMTPLQFMLEYGDNGVIGLRSHLDCAFDWKQDENN